MFFGGDLLNSIGIVTTRDLRNNVGNIWSLFRLLHYLLRAPWQRCGISTLTRKLSSRPRPALSRHPAAKEYRRLNVGPGLCMIPGGCSARPFTRHFCVEDRVIKVTYFKGDRKGLLSGPKKLPIHFFFGGGSLL